MEDESVKEGKSPGCLVAHDDSAHAQCDLVIGPQILISGFIRKAIDSFFLFNTDI